jgi:NADPH:quinone reductase-like Zn-dependent oxidoreductase
MQAIYQQRYGGSEVLTFGELPQPTIKPNQVLIEVHATSVNPRDWLIRSGKYQLQFLVPKFPLVLGSDVAGVVVAVGAKVKNFKQGDHVIALKNPSHGLATYAQYVAVDEYALALKPSIMSFEEAGGLPLCSLTAWQALADIAKLKQGDKVLIIGASGGVGTFAVQIAAALGAAVTAVCSTANHDLVLGLGATKAVDYKSENYKASLSGFDAVFDCIGRENLNTCRGLLNDGGIYVSTVPSPLNLKLTLLTTLKHRLWPNTKRAGVVMVKSRATDLKRITDLINRQQLRTVIDTTFPLAAAAQAHDLSRSLRAKGKIILKVR